MTNFSPTLKGTAKQKVLKKYPGAFAKEGLMSGNWYIHRANGEVLATAVTEAHAWKIAAGRFHE